MRAKVENGGESGTVSIDKTQYDPSLNKSAKCPAIFEELSNLWSVERSTRKSRKRTGCKSHNRKPDRAPRHRAGGGGPIDK